MADQYKAPYGDIIIANTPTLDSVAKQLYATQQMRQVQQLKENQALDAQMNKEFANIRSVDTPDVVNTYNELKNAKKQLYFNKDLQRNPLLYNQAQQYANEAQAKLNTLINKSREVKEMQGEMIKDHFKNPDAYSDDFGVRTNTLMNTPISQLQAHPQFGDLTNWDNYRYQGSNTNFNDHLSKAFGQPKKILGKEEPLDKQGIQFRTPVYEYGNTPGQVFEGLVNSLDHKTERDAAFKWKQLNPEDIQKVEQQYAAIPQSKWEQMGLPGPQKIDLRAGGDAEKYMRLLAMQNAVNTQPRLSAYQNRTSEKAKEDFNLNKSLILARVNHGYRDAEIRLRDELKNKGESEQNDIVDELYDNLKEDALKNPKQYKPAKGEPYSQYSIKVTEPLKNMFAVKDAKGHSIYPDDIRYSKDLQYVVPVFYEHYEDKKGNRLPDVITDDKGTAKVNADYSKPILEKEFKERYKKELLGVQGYNKSLKVPKKETSATHIESLRQKYNY